MDLSRLSGAATDGGTCLFSLTAIQQCVTQQKFGLASGFGMQTASGATCQALCAAEPCDQTGLMIAGPVPLSYG